MGILFRLVIIFIGSVLISYNAFSQKVEIKNTACCDFPIDALAFNSSNKTNYGLASSYGCDIKLWNLYGYELAELKGHGDYITALQFSPNGYKLASSSRDKTIKIWDILLQKELYTLQGHTDRVTEIKFTTDGKFLWSAGKDGQIILWDVENGKIFSTFKTDSAVNDIEISRNNQHLISGHEDGSIKIWNIAQRKEITSYHIHKETVTALTILPDTMVIISGSEDKTIKIFDTKSNKIILSLDGHHKAITDLALQKNENSNYLISSAKDETIRIWNLKNGTEKTVVSSQKSVVSKIVGNYNATTFITGGEDRKIRFWSLEQAQEILRAELVGDEDFMLSTPEYYFHASDNAYAQLIFSSDNPNAPSDLIEVKLDRPDMVTKGLGLRDSFLTKAYYQAYKKRIQKTGYSNYIINNINNLVFSQLEITDTLPNSTDKKEIEVSLKASSEKSPLKWIKIRTNGNVQYKNFVQKKIYKYEGTTNVVLSNGENIIELSVVNTKGLESKKIVKKIFYYGSKLPKRLYILSIGVSKYADSNMNLQCPSKDAKDVIECFKLGNKDLIVYDKLLTDSAVTKEKIFSEAKEFFADCKPDDQVIIFFGGDGLMDSRLNYYLTTHHTNFSYPSEESILFSEFEFFLNGIPAREKLFLLDASYAGEIDPNYTKLVKRENHSKKIKFRSSQSIGFNNSLFKKDSIPSFGLKNSFELMKELFRELSPSKGLNTIASAGGYESARESSRWNNSIFVYALLKGLEKMEADSDKDGKVMVSELNDFLTSGWCTRIIW